MVVSFLILAAAAVLGLLIAAGVKTCKRVEAIHGETRSRCEACGGWNGDVEHVVYRDSYTARCPQCRATQFLTWWPYWADEDAPDVAVDVFLETDPAGAPVLRGTMRDLHMEITRLANEGATLILRFR